MKNNFLKLALAVLTVGLLGSCAKINERLDGLDKRIDGLENERIASIDKQIENINSSISDLGTIRSNIQSLTSTAASHGEDIADLQAADEALGDRIDDLKKYVDDTLKGTTEWVKGTFSTLEQYEATCDTIAEIDAKIGALDEKLSEEISKCAESMKTWVNEQLDAYYTAAEIDAKLKAFRDTTVTPGLDSVAAEISKTKDAVDSAKANIRAEYKAAVKEAIEANNGFVTEKIKNNIKNLKNRVEELEEEVSVLTGRVDALAKMIQSIEYVPENSDKAIIATYSGDINKTLDFQDLVINYRVTPASVLNTIFSSAEHPEKLFKLFYKGVKLDTKADVPSTSIAVKSVTQDPNDKGIITVVVDSAELTKLPVRNCISDHTTLSLALGYANGATDYVGTYTNVNFKNWTESFEEDYMNVYLQLARLVGSKQQGKDYNAYRVLFNVCADDVCAAGARDGKHNCIAELNDFTYTADNEVIYNCYTNLYKAIDVCNRFLNKYYDFDGDLKYSAKEGVVTSNYNIPNRYQAEIRVLRVWLHFNLAIGWGNPPLVTGYPAPANPTNSDPDASVGSNMKNILNWCIRELDSDLLNNLAYRQSSSDKDGAYFVRYHFAKALFAKILMFRNNTDDMSKASAFLKEICENNLYYLASGEDRYRDLFHVEGNGCEEKIFELNMERYSGPGYVDDSTTPYMGMETGLWNWNNDGFVTDPMAKLSSVKGSGILGATEFAEQMFSFEGSSNRFKATFKSIFEAIYESTNYESDELNNMNIGEKIASDKIGIKAAGLYGQRGYLPFKSFVCDNDINPATGNNMTNFTVMRYAEVMLLLAEAYIRTTNPSEAKKYLNAIQKRAGAPEGGEVTLEIIIKEKQRELWMEGCRWPDIVRWGDNTKAFDILREAGTEVTVLYDEKTRPIVPEESKTNIGEKLYFVTTKVKETGSFDKEKHKHFPFPTSVVKGNLKQNPAWE